MDDLCAEHKSVSKGCLAASAIKQPAAQRDPEEEMKNLIQELIGDRLLELSRYVKLDSRSKTVLIDMTSLRHDGYSVVNH